MDRVTPEQRSANMRAIRGTDTKPELAVRKLLHALGYRYRLHHKELPGKPDIVFTARRKVVFVHGCFWHQHPDPQCRDARKPKSNNDYWNGKLERNLTRDQETVAHLKREGWNVLVLWACQMDDPEAVQAALEEFLGPSRWNSKATKI